MLQSASLLKVDVWDHDLGAEGLDDLLYSTEINVPYCSMFADYLEVPEGGFTSKIQEVNCTTQYIDGCEADDSLWKMQRRKQCIESGWVNFFPGPIPDGLGGMQLPGQSGHDCTFDTETICLKITFIITPLRIEPLPVAGTEWCGDACSEDYIKSKIKPNVMGKPEFKSEWTENYGFVYTDLENNRENAIDTDEIAGETLWGALMLRTSNDDKDIGNVNYNAMYFAVNFPVYVFICRIKSQNGYEGVFLPPWIKAEGYRKNGRFALRGCGSDPDCTYECFSKYHPGTVRNKWGGIESGAIRLKTNVVEGVEEYRKNYVVAVLPVYDVEVTENVEIVYDGGVWNAFFVMHGLPAAWFAFLAMRYIRKNIDFQLDRIPIALISKTYFGMGKKHILSTLFFGNLKTMRNTEFRSHLYYSTGIIQFFLFLPLILVFGWGVNMATKVQPVSFSYFCMYFSLTGYCMWFGINSWKVRRWRLTIGSILSFVLSSVFICLFLIAAVISDPGVITYGYSVDFVALSVIFGMVECFPMLQYVLRRDRVFQSRMTGVLESMSELAGEDEDEDKEDEEEEKKKEESKFGSSPSKWGAKKEEKVEVIKYLPRPKSVNRTVHKMLRDCYTLHPNHPIFKYSTIMNESFGKASDLMSLPFYKDQSYQSVCFTRFVYLIFCIYSTDYAITAFYNICSLFLLDYIHSCLAFGELKWEPQYQLALLIAGRMIIMSSDGVQWILTYSLAYSVYSIALLYDVVNTMMPLINLRELEHCAFYGKDPKVESIKFDLSGTSSYCYFVLTCFFVLMVYLYAISTPSDAPGSQMTFLGASWPAYTASIIAIFIVITGGLLIAAMRGFELEKQGLLRGRLGEVYFLRSTINLPIFLMLLTIISFLFLGGVINGITGSPLVLILAIFLPLIGICLYQTYEVWIKNDYDLIVWPRVGDIFDDDDDEDDDAADALNAAQAELDSLIEDSKEGEARTMKGFELPTLKAIPADGETDRDIKMPSLPLKSALREKRAKLGIESNSLLVKDSQIREGADGDKFGDADEEVLDINDPFAQYRDSDEESDEEVVDPVSGKKSVRKRIKQKTGLEVNYVEQSIWDDPNVVMALDVLNKVGGIIKSTLISIAKSTIRFIDIVGTLMYNALTQDDGEDDGDLKSTHANFWEAVVEGKLNGDELTVLFTWFAGLFFILLMGITIGGTISPPWLGHVIWYATFQAIFTLVPIIKYFQIYSIDSTMKQFIALAILMHILFCILFWFVELEKKPDGIVSGLWVLDYFFYYPVIVLVTFEFYLWRDQEWVILPIDKDGDGKISVWEYIMYIKIYPLFVGMMIVFNWQVYYWIDYNIGLVFTCALLAGAVGYFFIRDWALNDFYISPAFSSMGSIMITIIIYVTAFMIIDPFGMVNSKNPIFTMCIFLLALTLRSIAKLMLRLQQMDLESQFFLSKQILPIFTFESRSNSLHEEEVIMTHLLKLLIIIMLLGSLITCFTYPVYPGISFCCYYLLTISILVIAGMMYIPEQLSRVHGMMTSELLLGASNAASEEFEARAKPWTLDLENYKENDHIVHVQKEVPEDEFYKTHTALQLAEFITDLKLKMEYLESDESIKKKKALNPEEPKELTFEEEEALVIAESGYGKKNKKKEEKGDIEEDEVDNEKEKKPSQYQILVGIIGEYSSMFRTKIYEAYIWLMGILQCLPPEGYVRHSEALFSFSDAIAEAIIAGKGPFGFIGMQGKMYEFLQYAEKVDHYKYLRQSWLIKGYDKAGNFKKAKLLDKSLDHASELKLFPKYQSALDTRYFEEYRASAHFLLMILVASKARMQRERILFQKFLRESRLSLKTSGITIPSHIFKTSSYTSINITHVAQWLMYSLNAEERLRFHSMKEIFNYKGLKQDAQIDDDDYEYIFYAESLRRKRRDRDRQMVSLIQADIDARKEMRINKWVKSLTRAEGMKFNKMRKLWTSGKDVFVDSNDVPLHEKFLESQKSDVDPLTLYARETLDEVEHAENDMVRGSYGRNFQYVDPLFPPNWDSIGESDEAQLILGWRCAPGINYECTLIEGGTDADDVHVGIFRNGWLLSALMMLAAVGEEGSEKLQVMQNFIQRKTLTGDLTANTSVGAYIVRLFKECQWVPVLLDDLFPMLQHEYWTDVNAGMAVAHSAYGRELWVPLLEKCFAKFYGSYSALNEGYVHHALEELTGFDSEVIFLAKQSRGSNKLNLWSQMIKFFKNGYMLGAGTGSSKFVDKEILDMGIAFDSCYVVMDVRYIDGLRLIQMRNPPGRDEEWKGDWSDASTLWTKRLRKKLNQRKGEYNDNRFWMAFDDFCNVFRHLYVCKYLSPVQWYKTAMTGEWKNSGTLEYEQKKMMKEMFKSLEDMDEAEEAENREKDKRDAARAAVVTSGGMPCRHNPNCKVGDNPTYSLLVNRPTDIVLTLRQVDIAGDAKLDPHPASIFICKIPENKTQVDRLAELNEKNIVFYSGLARAETQISIHNTILPGKYAIVCMTYEAGLEGHFDVILRSNYRVDLLPVWPPSWMLKGARQHMDKDTTTNDLASLQASAQQEKRNKTMKKLKRFLVDLVGTGNNDVIESSSESDGEREAAQLKAEAAKQSMY